MPGDKRLIRWCQASILCDGRRMCRRSRVQRDYISGRFLRVLVVRSNFSSSTPSNCVPGLVKVTDESESSTHVGRSRPDRGHLNEVSSFQREMAPKLWETLPDYLTAPWPHGRCCNVLEFVELIPSCLASSVTTAYVMHEDSLQSGSVLNQVRPYFVPTKHACWDRQGGRLLKVMLAVTEWIRQQNYHPSAAF